MTIRARIRAAIRGGEQSPQAISAAIIPQLDVRQLRDALAAALPYLVRDEIRKYRHDALGDREGERGTEDRRWREPNSGELEVPQSQLPSAVAERSQRLRDAGRRGFDAAQAGRERNRALLATPIAVGKGVWKQLGECTPEDLRTVARGLRVRAAENEKRADGFERLARKLDAAGATTVAAWDGELRGEFVGG